MTDITQGTIWAAESELKKLPDSYRKNGYDYTILKREGDVAIFKQQLDDNLIAFEVFEIGLMREWGINAFICFSLAAAELRFLQIQEAINNRNKSQ